MRHLVVSWKRLRCLRLLCLCSCVGVAAAPQPQLSSVRLVFEPESPAFAAVARQYDSLWAKEGPRMVQALERTAGLRFADIGDTIMRVIVFEGVSYSGTRTTPMRLRASYPVPTKQATLMHELGHRLGAGVWPQDVNEHPLLYLWLYDAWVLAYGETFAREQMAIERSRGGVYPGAWDSALTLSQRERAAKWDSLKATRR